MVQLGGNVDAIRRMKLDCMRTDEMDERYALIEWEKPRAGPAPDGTQRKWRDRTKRYGAPALIAIVRAMTEPLRELAGTCEREMLFICEHVGGAKPGYRGLSYLALTTAAHWFLENARTRIKVWNKEHPENPEGNNSSVQPARNPRKRGSGTLSRKRRGHPARATGAEPPRPQDNGGVHRRPGHEGQERTDPRRGAETNSCKWRHALTVKRTVALS